MPFYPQEVVEDVRAQNDIVDVISSYVQLKQKGNMFWGFCPFHREKTPSFSVTPSRQIYYCFGCGAGGNVIGFLMNYENFGFVDTLKFLAERIGYKLPEPGYDVEYQHLVAEKKAMLTMHKEAARFFYDYLGSDSALAKVARQYLINRRISPQYARKFGLGAIDGGKQSPLFEYLHKTKGYSPELIIKAGLASYGEKACYDRFKRRLMFPIFDIQGRVIAFGGRILGEGNPKYLNSAETPIFDKSRTLYGMNFARRETNEADETLILVEGYMDLIALYQAGFRNVAACMGTAFGIQHARILKSYCKRVVLLFDADSAGEKAVLRAAPILAKEGLQVKVLRLNNAKDPDEFINNYGAPAFSKALEYSEEFTKFQIGLAAQRYDLNRVADKVAFAKEAGEILGKLESAIEREAYLQDLSESVKLDANILRQEIAAPNVYPDFVPPKLSIKPFDSNVSEGCDDARRRILYLMATNDEYYPKIIHHIKREELENPIYIEIFDIIYQLRQIKQEIAIADIVGYVDIEMQSKFAAVFSVDMSIDAESKLENILMDSMREVKITHINNLMRSQVLEIMEKPEMLAELNKQKLAVSGMVL